VRLVFPAQQPKSEFLSLGKLDAVANNQCPADSARLNVRIEQICSGPDFAHRSIPVRDSLGEPRGSETQYRSLYARR